jgi:hypothetical protein
MYETCTQTNTHIHTHTHTHTHTLTYTHTHTHAHQTHTHIHTPHTAPLPAAESLPPDLHASCPAIVSLLLASSVSDMLSVYKDKGEEKEGTKA